MASRAGCDCGRLPRAGAWEPRKLAPGPEARNQTAVRPEARNQAASGPDARRPAASPEPAARAASGRPAPCGHAAKSRLHAYHDAARRGAHPPVTDSPDSPVDLTVVVPLFNEEDSLRELAAELAPVLRSLTADHEILFVDDGSTDGSARVLAELAAADPRVTVVRLDRNHGLSSALHAGFRHARGALIATIDADLQNDPADLPKLIEAVHSGADLALGWRTDRRDPFVKRASSRIANWWRNRRTGSSIHDVTCPLKVMRREVRECLYPFHGLHRFLPTLAEMAGFRVVEIPVGHRPRRHGVSKYGVWNRVFRGMRDLRAVRWMQDRRMTYRAERAGPGGPRR